MILHRVINYTLGRTNKTRQSNTTPSGLQISAYHRPVPLYYRRTTHGLTIKHILSRRRKSDGNWLYQVVFQSGEKHLLPARDIDHATVRQYISRQDSK